MSNRISIGTKLAVVGTTVACLPSLISLYYDRLGLGKPPVDLLKYYSTLHVIYRAPRFHFCSNIHSVLVHFFHHMDISHLRANLLCLTSSALSADLGFFGTLYMLVSGGVVGLAVDIMDRCKIRSNGLTVVGKTGIDVIQNPIPSVKTPQNLWNWFSNKIANPELFNYVARVIKPDTNISSTVYSICGLDSAVCTIVGVDAYKLYKESGSEISDTWRDAMGLKSSHGRIHVIGRLGVMATEIATLVLEPHVKNSRRLYGEERHVGVAGRIASFLFGFGVYAVYDVIKDYREKNRKKRRIKKKIEKAEKDFGNHSNGIIGKPFKNYTINDDYFF